MSAVETEPIRLDNVLGVDVRPGLVDIRGRIIRDGVVECEAAGVVQRGDIGLPLLVFGRVEVEPAQTRADVFWYETTMEIHERQRPASWH